MPHSHLHLDERRSLPANSAVLQAIPVSLRETNGGVQMLNGSLVIRPGHSTTVPGHFTGRLGAIPCTRALDFC